MPNLRDLDPQQACNQVWVLGFDCQYNPTLQTWQTGVITARTRHRAAPRSYPTRTPIRLDYQNLPPVHLYRHKRDGEDVRFLSTNPGPFPGSSPGASIGGVYGPAGGIAGLVQVHEFECYNACEQGRTTGYYTTDSNALAGGNPVAPRRPGVLLLRQSNPGNCATLGVAQ